MNTDREIHIDTHTHTHTKAVSIIYPRGFFIFKIHPRVTEYARTHYFHSFRKFAALPLDAQWRRSAIVVCMYVCVSVYVYMFVFLVTFTLAFVVVTVGIL